MSNLHDTDYQIQFKSGSSTDINSTATVNTAIEGEPHWATDTDSLFVYDGTQNKQVVMIDPAGAPASAGASGSAGDIAYDGSFLYICVATDTWLKCAIATW